MTVPDSSAFGPTGPAAPEGPAAPSDPATGPSGRGAAGGPVRLDGPWTHRDVAANGARFHIAELGEGPLVLLLHGFPQFW
ncbi:alpha/beta hydrolase, partial [Streptomyces sp. SID7982]|nr:alpha/beta hydrolase [Streptomyces sp. SID7982]